MKQGSQKDTFVINHCQGTLPVTYNARGWLKLAREHAATKQAHPLLADSSKYEVVFVLIGNLKEPTRPNSFPRRKASFGLIVLFTFFAIDVLCSFMLGTKTNVSR